MFGKDRLKLRRKRGSLLRAKRDKDRDEEGEYACAHFLFCSSGVGKGAAYGPLGSLGGTQ